MITDVERQATVSCTSMIGVLWALRKTNYLQVRSEEAERDSRSEEGEEEEAAAAEEEC